MWVGGVLNPSQRNLRYPSPPTSFFPRGEVNELSQRIQGLKTRVQQIRAERAATGQTEPDAEEAAAFQVLAWRLAGACGQGQGYGGYGIRVDARTRKRFRLWALVVDRGFQTPP